ncbi:MAG: alpha/beta hydrolase [Fimbriimonadaceae bacterium]|nr:alpha/beta hydrolase [Fimbriimonadaceae bacterium]
MPSFVLFPGLAADHRLFSRQLAALPDTLTPAWLKPNQDGSLADFARRQADALPAGPLVLVGFSFGGMVVQEMCRVASVAERVKGVALISGIHGAGALTPAFLNRCRAVQKVPDALVRAALRIGSRSFGRDEPISAAERASLAAMAADLDVGFFRWAAGACLTWQGLPPSRAFADLPHAVIHGRADRVIPPLPTEVTHWIDGGHLIQWTQADQVNRILSGLA